MKKQFLSFGLMLLSGVAMAQYPTDGLVAYFPLDGNGNDAGPNSITPVSMNAVAATDRNNAANGAYYFSTAENHFIEYSLTAFTELQVAGDMTIAFYAKLEGHFSGNTLPTAVAISDKVRAGMNVVGTFPSISVRAGFERFSDGTNASLVSGMLGNSSVTGSWNHYAFVREGQQLIIYVNGQEAVNGYPINAAADIDFGINDLVMRIGQSADGDAQKKYRGTIDDVFIYDRALTVGEVTDLFEFNSLPTFLVQPLSQHFTCAVGQLVELTVNAVNAASVQWQFEGQEIPNADIEYYAFNLSGATAGDYTCVITGYDGSTVTSNVATISLDQIVLSYDPVTYTLSASATYPEITRWRLFRDGNQIATGNSGTLSYVINASGSYHAIFDQGCSIGNIITVRPGGSGGAGSSCLHTVNTYGTATPLQAVQVSNGQTYNYTTAPNETGFTINNATACGTTVNLTITDANGCWDTYVYNNQANFNEQVSRTPNLKCSTQTNTLNVTLVYNETATDVICAGSTYNIGNQSFTDAGEYIVNLTSVNGADSIVTLTLTEGQPITGSATANLCPNSTLTIAGQTITQTGTYTEVLISALGCDSTVTWTVVSPEAELTFDAATATLSGSSTLSGWVLTLNGSQVNADGGDQFNHTATQSGTYEVTFGSTDCGLGTVTLTQNGSNLTVDVPGATPPIAANISWPSNPGGVNGTWQTASNTYTGMSPSAYTLLMTDANGCSESVDFVIGLVPNPTVIPSLLPTEPCQATASIEVDLLAVGMNEASASTLSLYPNPSTTSFTMDGLTAGSTITVMDAMGRNVMSQAATASRIEVSVAGLSAGIYMVQVQDGNGVRTARLMVN